MSEQAGQGRHISVDAAVLNGEDLAVWRGDRCLFSGLNLAVNAGELLYVSGPNGSGKTTLLRMLCGLVYAEEGVIRWSGDDIRELGDDYHRELFYFGHLNGIKGELTALENLKMAAALAGWALDEEPILDALERMGLEGYEDLPTRVLSQGQKRRVALAGLLLTRARLWILDEPFTALDVAAIATLRDTLRAHLEARGFIVLTTHQEIAIDAQRVRHLKMGQAPDRDA
jgi:heme exporter protein A